MRASVNHVVALASELQAARATVARLEAELDRLLGGVGSRAAGPGSSRRSMNKPPPAKAHSAGRAGDLSASPGRLGRKPGPTHARVVELAREGVLQGQIAARLGITVGAAHGHIIRAREAGELEPEGDHPPKAAAAPVRAASATLNGNGS